MKKLNTDYLKYNLISLPFKTKDRLMFVICMNKLLNDCKRPEKIIQTFN